MKAERVSVRENMTDRMVRSVASAEGEHRGGGGEWIS